jgi:membrane carboxypeptidase/penicillin-binding protein PbpC
MSRPRAVNTGTSSDFRDAWAVGFHCLYTVGAWMGNLDETPMDGVTGTTEPALLLRSVCAELTRDPSTAPLCLSPAPVQAAPAEDGISARVRVDLRQARARPAQRQVHCVAALVMRGGVTLARVDDILFAVK